MKETLIIIGASGHGKVVADIAVKMNQWKNIYFLDDDETVKQCLGFNVIGKVNDAVNYKDESDFFVAVGNNKVRKKIMEKIKAQDLNITTLIHPSAAIGLDVKIDIGSVVMAGSIVNSSSIIGIGCIVNTRSSIDHDCVIEEYIHISPGATIAGSVCIKKNSWLGVGCIVTNNINITDDSVIGAGTVVIRDIITSGTYIGIPARRVI